MRSHIINWGNSRVVPSGPNVNSAGRMYNSFHSVHLASNKILTLEKLKENGINIPEFTSNDAVACEWIRDGRVVMCRTNLRGHSGNGIVVAETLEQIVDAPLYTQYIKKRKEFRVHVAFGKVIDVQEKRRRKDFEERNAYVRSAHTGWVFCRDGIVEPEGIRDLAVRSVNALGLDFGACDIIWNERRNQCYVLEVNTAPGLEGSTIKAYTDAFVTKIKEV